MCLSRPEARLKSELALAILGLALIAVAGAFTLGPLLVPAIALALLAWASGRKALKAEVV